MKMIELLPKENQEKVKDFFRHLEKDVEDSKNKIDKERYERLFGNNNNNKQESSK